VEFKVILVRMLFIDEEENISSEIDYSMCCIKVVGPIHCLSISLPQNVSVLV
jgi:hypothetical protein